MYLKLINTDGEVTLTDTGCISGNDMDGCYFSPSRSPDENVHLLSNQFDPFSIINCFDIFAKPAAKRIAAAHEAGTLESMFQGKAGGSAAR